VEIYKKREQLTRPLFVTFNYEAWPLAAHIELLQESSSLGLNPLWLDLTGIFRNHFEFPVSDRLQIFLMKKKLHAAFPCLAEINIHSEHLNRWCEESEIIGQAEMVAYQELISLTRNSKPCLRHNSRLFREIRDLYIRDFEFALRFLKDNKPTQVVLFNGRFVEERAFWNAAKILGVKVVFYETFIHSWHNRYFLFDEPTHSPAYRGDVMEKFGSDLALLSPDKFDLGAKEFFEDRALGEGNKFTEFQDSSTNFDSDLPIVSFFHSSQDELIMVNLIDKFWTSQEMALQELVEQLNDLGRYRLVIRIHPHLLHKAKEEINRWNNLGKMYSSEFDWVTYISADDPANTYDLIRASKIVVTCASTVGVEASYLRKPSILLGRAFHEGMGITQVVNSRDQLRQYLTNAFSNETLDQARVQAMKYGAFLQLGGQKFQHVSVSSLPRLNYQFNDIRISKSLGVRIIQHIELKLRNFLRNLKFSVVCDHDCGIDSSSRWK
jgi:hypothetical protein